jgi:hypothetical protein
MTILLLVVALVGGAYLQYKFNLLKYVGLNTPNVD